MRKQIFLFAIAFFVFTCNMFAQFEKGGIYPGISIGRHLFDYNTNSARPSVMIGLGKHSAAGVSYHYTRLVNNPASQVKGYSVVRGGELNYVYAHSFRREGKWGWYSNLALGRQQVSVYDNTATNLLNNRYTENYLSFTPGIYFQPSQRLLLYANMGDISVTKSRHGFTGNLHIGSQLNVGVLFRLGRLSKK